MTDAVAWIGQSTVACAINRAWANVEANVKGALVLLQEHDSIVGETLVSQWAEVKPQIREQFMRVVIPYDDPLVIPPDLKSSAVSWGDMEKEQW